MIQTYWKHAGSVACRLPLCIHSRDDKTNLVTFFTSFSMLNPSANMIHFSCRICSPHSRRCSLRYNWFGSPCCIFLQKLAFVLNWSGSQDLIPRCRLSKPNEPRRCLSGVLIDTPLSYRSNAMVTLLKPRMRFQDVDILVSDCTMSVPSMI